MFLCDGIIWIVFGWIQTFLIADLSVSFCSSVVPLEDSTSLCTSASVWTGSFSPCAGKLILAKS